MAGNVDVMSTLKSLIRSGKISTQEELVARLREAGCEINQTKISRLLRKIGAVKAKNESGEIVYQMPLEPPPPMPKSHLSDLLIDITFNENCLVVNTSPGAASLIARVIDYQRTQLGVLGTIAGDDTVMVIPAKLSKIQHIQKALFALLEPNC